MRPLFDSTISPKDENYLVLRDSKRFSNLKEFCEDLWLKFKPYADDSFKREIANQFYPRYWEMYLGCALIDLGFELVQKKSDKGPDLHLRVEQSDLWIEATLPDKGKGVDAVPVLEEHFRFDPIPEDKIILRFTNSISVKSQKLMKYLKDGIVMSNDLFIIAINGCMIPFLDFYGDIPYVVKSVFPLGDLVVTIDINKLVTTDTRYKYREEIIKESGSAVSTSSFIDHDLSAISGVIFSNADIWSRPQVTGLDFTFIHNHLARNPVKKGWLGAGKEYWLKEGYLQFRNHS
jgi:hypothetical protein